MKQCFTCFFLWIWLLCIFSCLICLLTNEWHEMCYLSDWVQSVHSVYYKILCRFHHCWRFFSVIWKFKTSLRNIHWLKSSRTISLFSILNLLLGDQKNITLPHSSQSSNLYVCNTFAAKGTSARDTTGTPCFTPFCINFNRQRIIYRFCTLRVLCFTLFVTSKIISILSVE